MAVSTALLRQRSQNVGKAPLAVAFEGEEAPGQFIPVRPRRHHTDLRRPIDINQRWRFQFGPERLPAQLTYSTCATAAKHRVFLLTADAVDRNEHSQQINQGALQRGDDPPRSSLVRATTTRPHGFGNVEVGIDAAELPGAEPRAKEGEGHSGSLNV